MAKQTCIAGPSYKGGKLTAQCGDPATHQITWANGKVSNYCEYHAGLVKQDPLVSVHPIKGPFGD